VQQDLAAVGVTVQLNPVGSQALQDAGGRRKNVPMAVWTWLANFNDPKDTLDFTVNGERIVDKGCYNFAFYSNPRVNELFHQAAPELDVGKRLRLYQELEGIVVDDAPWIFLFNVDNYNFRQESLKGYKMRSIWPDRLENTWLDR
jgi:peptide/nickel transport system substrate-binding protein